MQIIKIRETSLGLETFEALGFRSEDELNKELLKLIKVRSEFESKQEVESC